MGDLFTTVRNYGEICLNSDDCWDARTECVPGDNETLRCLCDKYHAWNESMGCVQVYSINYIMNQTVKNLNFAETVEAIQENTFMGAIYSVFFIICVTTTCFVAVIVYCLHIRKRDRLLKQSVRELSERNITVKWGKRDTCTMV